MSVRISASVTASLFLLWSNWASAQNELSTPAETTAARELAYDAKTHFDNREYEQAAADAEAAYRLVPAPTLALLAARSKVELGKWSEALLLYRAAVAPSGLLQTTALVRAQQIAQEELARLQKRMPLVRIERPESMAKGVVSIDATPIPENTFGIWFPYDPGEHTLTWKSESGEEISQKVHFQEAKRQRLRVVVAPQNPARTREFAFGIAGLSTGALGVGLGIGFGLAAQSQQEKLSNSCIDFACPESDSDTIDRYDAMRTASTVGYIVGLTSAAAGGFLLWRSAREKESLNLQLSATPQTLNLRGAF